MRRHLLLSSVLVAAMLQGPVSEAHVGSHDVVIKDNAFQPQVLEVDPGETVSWTALESGHTATADLGEFDFHPTRQLQNGERVEWTTPLEDRWVFYRCKVHGTAGDGSDFGRGMVGAIRVGDPPPLPPPPPEPQPDILQVPADYSLEQALAVVQPGKIIELARGAYSIRTAVVAVPDVTLRGPLDASPGEVVLQPEAAGTAFGISVVAPDVRIENLTVRGFRVAGIAFDRVESFAAERTVTTGSGDYGILVSRSRRGVVRDALAAGKSRAGFAVRLCRDCDVLIEGVTAQGNFVGVEAENAGALHLLGSAIRDNGTGIVIRTAATEEQGPQRGSHLYGNTIERNAAAGVPRPPFFAVTADRPMPAGAGIWIAGGWENVVESNMIRDQRYGVLVSALTAPPRANRVAGNTVMGHSAADLGFDGTGTENCFSSNEHRTSDPPAVETLYDCAYPTTVGVPNPAVSVDPVVYAWRTAWCRELGAGCV